MEKSTGERLAILETRLEELMRDHTEIMVSMRQHAELDRESHEHFNNTLDGIKEQLDRYKGFVGGVMFVFAGVWAFIKALPGILSLVTHR